MFKIVQDDAVTADPAAGGGIDLDEVCRLAAQEMLAVTLLAERRAYLDAHARVVDGAGHRVVVGNGFLPTRQVTTGAGRVEVTVPRVHDPRPDHRFTSRILPSYMRRSPKVTEVLPVLYLRGLSTGDFAPALESFLGSDAGLSASTISRLCEAWQAEHTRWAARDLSGVDYVYWWVDGIWFNVRLPDPDGNHDRLCCLVIIGVRPDGSKELVAVWDGYRESTDSWAELLRGLRDRSLKALTLAVGDGALGSGRRSGTSSTAGCGNRDAGCTRPPTSSTPYPSGSTPKRSQRSRPSTWPNTGPTQSTGSATSPTPSRRSRKRWPRSPASSTLCSPSTTTRKSTGSTCGPPTPSNRRSPPSASEPRSPRVPGAGPPPSPWPTSCAPPPSNDGVASTATTWSPSSGPEPSSSTDNYKKGAPPTKPTPRTSPPDPTLIHNI